MAKERFYYEIYPLESSEILHFEGDEFHHLHRVMRCKEGDLIEIVNGKGELAVGKIVKISKSRADVEIEQAIARPNPLPPLHLCLALIKLPRLEWALEKGTELGVSHFHLFSAEKSEKHSLSPTQTARCRSICISALKQCKRLDLPEIHLYESLKEIKLPEGERFFGDPETEEREIGSGKNSSMAFFTGPEQGWSKNEKMILEENLHAQPLRLSPHVLRAETAAILGIGLLSQKR